MLFMCAVGEVEPRHIHSSAHQIAYNRLRIACWSKSADDLGPSSSECRQSSQIAAALRNGLELDCWHECWWSAILTNAASQQASCHHKRTCGWMASPSSGCHLERGRGIAIRVRVERSCGLNCIKEA